MLKSASFTFETGHPLVSDDFDEPTRLAFYLSDCANKFMSSNISSSSSSTNPQILPALKCLYMALSLVLAPQFEAELRLRLGIILLDHTQNFKEALIQLQKAHKLAQSSSGAINFGQKCRIIRSLVDALLRTNSHQLANDILIQISLESLHHNTDDSYHWFIHFALMSLQYKFESQALPQVLTDLDEILVLIASQQSSPHVKICPDLLLSSKIIFLSFLLIILSDERKMLSVFMTIPRAAQELREALDCLYSRLNFNNINGLLSQQEKVEEISAKTSTSTSAVDHFGVLLFAESLLLLNSLSCSDSNYISLHSSKLDNLITIIDQIEQNKHHNFSIKLPGHLTFASYKTYKLLIDFSKLLIQRQTPRVSLVTLYEQIESIQSRLKYDASNGPEEDKELVETLLTAVDCFKISIDLEAGKMTLQKPDQDSKSQNINMTKFTKTFKDFILSFTAHTFVQRFGLSKAVTFYDHKIHNTLDVDLQNLLILNRSLLTGSTDSITTALEATIQNLQLVNNTVIFYLIRAIELKRLNPSAAHHIKHFLSLAQAAITQQPFFDPKIQCILFLLLGEEYFFIDFDKSRDCLIKSHVIAVDRIGNKFLANLAAEKLVSSFKQSCEDDQVTYWSNQISK